MGNKFKRRKRNRPQTTPSSETKKDWKSLVKENELLEKYYREVGVIPSEEYDRFMETMREPLPVAFRIAENEFAQGIKERISKMFPKEDGKEKQFEMPDGKKVDPPKPISWYPDQGAWYFGVSRKELRKVEGLEEFHQFLIHQTNCGNISRQEAVSMIPPIFLQVKPHHRVLDLCAAPGSKTAQIMEWIYAEKFPTGLVVANDVNVDRCDMLVRQLKRISLSSVMVTNHEAQGFPYIKVDPSVQDPSPNAIYEGKNTSGKVTFQFDSILCDVPCTGDGTLRKNPEIWSSWKPVKALGIHGLQIKIAQKGMHLLKVGGRMVYSTCSLNPIEDEAVVCEILRRSKGSLKLLDVSNELPDLKRNSGTSKWRVLDRNEEWYSSYEDLPEKRRNEIPKSLFPPTEEEAKEFGLDKCMRVLPHIQDTGGFFIAVFQKISPTFKSKEKNDEEISKEQQDISGKEEKIDEEMEKDELDDPDFEKTRKAATKRRSDEPFVPFRDEFLPDLKLIKDFFGIGDELQPEHLITRSMSQRTTKFHFISPGVRGLFSADSKKVLRIVNCGVRAFEKHITKTPIPCPYRLCQEAIEWIGPMVTKRVIKFSDDELYMLLTEKDPLHARFSPKNQSQLSSIGVGSILIVVEDVQKRKQWAGMMFAGWNGVASCHLLLKKEDVQSMLALCDGQ